MLATLATVVALAAPARGGLTTVETTGEAAILHDDVPSARLEAIARARWQAVEQVAGVEVRSSSFVNNFVLLDDAIIKRANGVITDSQVISGSPDGDIYKVRVRATVGPAPAREAMAQIARNRAIAVYLPARFPNGSVRDSHALTEQLIRRLTHDGYEVVDLADRKWGVSAKQLDEALQRDDYTSMRSVLYRYLTNVVLVGTVEFVLGTHTPFEIVTARVDYRLVGGDENGLRRVLASGHESGKGGGTNPTQALQRAIEELAKPDRDSAASKIFDDIQRNVKARAGRVRIAVDGVDSLGADQNVREALRAVAWVASVESSHMGEYVVEYPERPLYLAASLDHKRGFRVKDFTPSSVSMRYEAP